MAKDLTNSQIDRQNILNNDEVLKEFYGNFGIKGILFEDRYYFTKNMVALFYDVEVRTIERYISDYADELTANGYQIIRGKRLKSFIENKEIIQAGKRISLKRNKHWITEEKMRELAKPMLKNQYGQYLLRVIDEKKEDVDSDTFRYRD